MEETEDNIKGELDHYKPEPYETRYRWVMLALAWFLYFAFGAVMSSLAPLVTPILADLNISFSQMGIILGSCLLNVNVYNKPMTLSKVITTFRTDKNYLTIWGIDNASVTDFTKAPTYEMP